MTSLATGQVLLEHAVRYALASACPVNDGLLVRDTPCAGWNVHMLRCHLSESLDALGEGMSGGYVSPVAPEPGAAGCPDGELRERATRLLAACTAVAPERPVAIAGHDLTVSVLAATGAIEIAVHCWDLRVACGDEAPIPAGLASSLLRIAPLLVTRATRGGLFADPVPLPGPAAPGHQLVAFLGRDPAWQAAPC